MNASPHAHTPRTAENEIRDQGVKQVAEALKVNSTLSWLQLNCAWLIAFISSEVREE